MVKVGVAILRVVTPCCQVAGDITVSRERASSYLSICKQGLRFYLKSSWIHFNVIWRVGQAAIIHSKFVIFLFPRIVNGNLTDA